MTPRKPRAPAPPPPEFDPQRMYRVELSRVVQWGGVKFSPANESEMRGDVCDANKDAIIRYEPV